MRYLCELPGDRGVHPGADDNYAIRRAAQFGHVDVVRYLCELPVNRGVHPGADDNYAIRWAAHNGHVDVVRYLCELHGDRGVHPGADGHYAIRWAAVRGHVDVVRYLCVVLPPDAHRTVQRAFHASPIYGTPAQYLYYAYIAVVKGTWEHQPGFSKYHTQFARMLARQPLLMLNDLVRGRRCGWKQGMCGMDWEPNMEADGRSRRTRRRRRTRKASN